MLRPETMRSSNETRLLPTPSESALIAVFFLASSGTLQQYLGVAGALAYLAVLAALVPVAVRIVLPWFLARTSERSALWLALLTFAALVVVFAVVYPHANSHSGLTGSDRDDAANIATRHLLHGRYPYSTPTYLGNFVSQLPGALLLDSPFVLLGNSAYQNLFWLPALFLGLRYYFSDARLALFVVWFTLLAPAVMREFVTGGDLIANSIYVLLFVLGVIRFDPTTRGGRAWKVAAALALGLALSSRANFLFIVPLVFACLVRRESWRSATVYVGLTLAACACVTLPFYLYDTSRFTPLLTEGKFARLNDVVPHSSAVVLGVAGLLTLFLAWKRIDRRDLSVFRNDVVVQGFLIVAVVVLSSIQAGRLDFSFLVLGYGLFIVFAAAFGIWGAFPRAP
jgi:hypothetical protein